jgi:hypothetical protein
VHYAAGIGEPRVWPTARQSGCHRLKRHRTNTAAPSSPLPMIPSGPITRGLRLLGHRRLDSIYSGLSGTRHYVSNPEIGVRNVSTTGSQLQPCRLPLAVAVDAIARSCSPRIPNIPCRSGPVSPLTPPRWLKAPLRKVPQVRAFSNSALPGLSLRTNGRR